MTADEWLTCSSPAAMLNAVAAKPSTRKLRLIACAICRLVWDAIPDAEARAVVEAAEQFADGRFDEAHFRGWEEKSQTAVRGTQVETFEPTFMAAAAVRGVTLENPVSGAELTLRWAEQLALASRPKGRRAARTAFRAAAAAAAREIIGPLSHPLVLMGQWMLRGAGGPAAAFRERVTGSALGVAEAVAADLAFDRLPILADALEDGGLDDRVLLDHLRHGTGHVRGCWALELVLGRA